MLPETWINKIFMTFEGRYGSLFLDRWKGCDIENVKRTWREELTGFADQPERIGQALKTIADEKFPPTLPEFIAACRRAPGKEVPALTHKLSAEDHERMARAATEAKRAVERAGADKVIFWATHPKGHAHMQFIRETAQNDARFLPCIAEMAEKGICTEDGHLLKLYRDGAWYPAGKAV